MSIADWLLSGLSAIRLNINVNSASSPLANKSLNFRQPATKTAANRMSMKTLFYLMTIPAIQEDDVTALKSPLLRCSWRRWSADR
jgi:hypothetical protein